MSQNPGVLRQSVMSRVWERWIAAATLVFVMGIVALFIADRSRAAEAEAVRVMAHWEADRIKIDFDPANPAVSQADSGLLRVRDGRRSSEYQVEGRTLRSGGFDYRPESNDVSLTLVLLREGAEQAQVAVRAFAPKAAVEQTAAEPPAITEQTARAAKQAKKVRPTRARRR